MTIAECYADFGGDYDEMLKRLRREATISKLALKFLDDESYLNLKEALGKGDIEEAYRAAHTLKGICQNLAFTTLYSSSNELAEALKACDENEARRIMPSVEKDYKITAEALSRYKAEQD